MTTRKSRRAAERAAREQARQAAQLESQQSSVSPAAPTGPTRAEINRANAQLSTGPKSIEGKSKSSRNSFKHGLYSQLLVTGAEDAAELDALRADLRSEHQPANTTEEILVNEMAEQFWRLRRARLLEASLLGSKSVMIAHLTAAQRMMSAAERGFHKALTSLRQLQKDRGFVPQKAESDQNRGAVPSGPGTVELTAESRALSASPGSVPQSDHNCDGVPSHPGAVELAAESCELPASAA